ncbi:MAG TPA: aminoacyl-tRNA hydrolase [Bacteroidales bacterium]|nr:aminoacyl-tRNA hydrolase [Bacteroidales bacterium]HQI69139.1 aminoacyl-tRNA hydrolase [Bacteroidales bacterium]
MPQIESKKFLITGLGNVGDEYVNTRHNIGFVVMDALAQKLNVAFAPGRHGQVATARFKGKTLLLLKPSTFVNLSGKAVKYWLTAEDIPRENALVVVDDLDLPTGTLRMKSKGGDGGHNGLIDIITSLNSQEFARLRIGIGSDFARGFQVDYVLGKWTKDEEKILLERIPVAVEATLSFICEGVNTAMNKYNNK